MMAVAKAVKAVVMMMENFSEQSVIFAQIRAGDRTDAFVNSLKNKKIGCSYTAKLSLLLRFY